MFAFDSANYLFNNQLANGETWPESHWERSVIRDFKRDRSAKPQVYCWGRHVNSDPTSSKGAASLDTSCQTRFQRQVHSLFRAR